MAGNGAIVAVLAGGRATRMGASKATVALAGRPLISYPLAAAAAAGLPAIVLAKPTTELPPLAEPVVLEPATPTHPLLGLVSALDHLAGTEAAAVILLSCDMPFLTGPLLAWMAGLEGSAMASVGGRPQPFLSRVQGVHRERLAGALAAEESLTGAIASLAPLTLGEQEIARFGEPLRLCFSVNGPDELQLAERWIEGS